MRDESADVRRVRELLEKEVEESLSPLEQEELVRLLEERPETRDEAVRYHRDEMDLYALLGGEPPPVPVAPRRRPSWRRGLVGAVAALVEL